MLENAAGGEEAVYWSNPVVLMPGRVVTSFSSAGPVNTAGAATSILKLWLTSIPVRIQHIPIC